MPIAVENPQWYPPRRPSVNSFLPILTEHGSGMKCILHIGTEKTGTTTLQHWLYANRDSLSAAGVALPTVAGRHNNPDLISFLLQSGASRAEGHHVSAWDKPKLDPVAFAEQFQGELEHLAQDHHTVIVTSEHMHSRLQSVEQIAELKRLLDPVCTEFEVVCYFREQSQLRKSLYSTGLKVGLTKALVEFAADANPSSHYYNYVDVLRKWEEVFGKSAITARLHDRASFVDGDLRRDFLKATALAVDPASLSFEIEKENASFGRVGADVVRLLNLKYPVTGENGKAPLTRNRIMRVLLEMNGTHDKPLIDPRQVAFFDMFDASNRDFAERYLGRSENPFQRPAEHSPKAAELSETELTLRDALFETVSAWMDRSMPMKLRPAEFKALRDVALAGLEAGTVTKDQARQLLSLANRAYSHAPVVARALAQLDDDTA